MCTQDVCLWNLQNLTSGSLNPWIIHCDEMNQLWCNECWSLAERPCMVIQWPIRDECLWYFKNWISETLNPWIIPLVTKWTSGWPNEHKQIGLVWPFSDQYKMNTIGIFKIGYQKPLIPGLYPLWRNDQIVTKRLLVIARTHMVSSSVTHTRWTPLEFWRSDHRGPRY